MENVISLSVLVIFCAYIFYKWKIAPEYENKAYMEYYRDLRAPIIIRTFDMFDKEAEEKRAEYIALLKECGNTVLTEKDVHILAHNAVVNGKTTIGMTDFEYLVFRNKQEAQILEAFQMKFHNNAKNNAEAYDLRGQNVPNASNPSKAFHAGFTAGWTRPSK